MGERVGRLIGEVGLDEALARLRADVSLFTGAPPDDDSALVLVEYAPAQTSARSG